MYTKLPPQKIVTFRFTFVTSPVDVPQIWHTMILKLHYCVHGNLQLFANIWYYCELVANLFEFVFFHMTHLWLDLRVGAHDS